MKIQNRFFFIFNTGDQSAYFITVVIPPVPEMRPGLHFYRRSGYLLLLILFFLAVQAIFQAYILWHPGVKTVVNLKSS